MASGSETAELKSIRVSLSAICESYAMCGAGGGGFAVIILNEGVPFEALNEAVSSINRRRAHNIGSEDIVECSIHKVEIDYDGMSLDVFEMPESVLSLADILRKAASNEKLKSK